MSWDAGSGYGSIPQGEIPAVHSTFLPEYIFGSTPWQDSFGGENAESDTHARKQICKGTLCLAIQWMEDTLVKNGAFALPGKKYLKKSQSQFGISW
jgi:hypothetical protein